MTKAPDFMKKTVIATCCAALMVAGCATRAANVTAQYVTPIQYSNYSCEQVRTELVQISARVREVSGQQDRKASNDALATGVGIVLFWPALIFLMSGDHAAELSNLKGHYEALTITARQKNCAVAAELAAAGAGFQ